MTPGPERRTAPGRVTPRRGGTVRLTDTCTLKRTGTPWGGPRRCEFGHIGGTRDYDGRGRVQFAESARVIVGPDPALAALPSPSGLTVEHKGKSYTVSAILPRYRPGGRLHHVSLDLGVTSG